MHKPQPAILTIWRILLVIATLVPALLCSLFFQVGGLVWTVASCLWAAAFLFFYLFYLPVRYRRMAYTLYEDRLVFRSGVFMNRVRTMPLSSVQFASVYISPLDALWGLGSLSVTAAGGRILLPGLRAKDARSLAELLPGAGRSE